MILQDVRLQRQRVCMCVGGGGSAAGGAAAPPHAALCFLMTPAFGAIFAGRCLFLFCR